MCKDCYIEHGSPRLINENTIRAAELVEALYDTEDGGAGGYGHIVFDDWNIETPNITWCIKEAEKGEYRLCEETRLASIEALNAFLPLSEDERRSALAIHQKILVP